MQSTPYAALRSIADRSRPLVTFYDGLTGERAELSVATLDNGIAKTASLLRDGMDLQPGAVIALHLPLHWQLSVWLGACWSAGYVAAPGGDPSRSDLCVVDVEGLDLAGQAPETALVSLEPFGAPPRVPVPADVLNHAVESRSFGDSFTPYAAPAAGDAAVMVDGAVLSAGDVMRIASEVTTESRPLVSDASSVPAWLAALAVPLANDGSVVLVRRVGADAIATIADQERAAPIG